MSGTTDLLRTELVLDNRWKVTSKISSGEFSQVYEAIDQETMENVAIRVESTKQEKQLLKMDVTVLRRLQDSGKVCRCIHSRSSNIFNFCVTSLPGRNLAELRRAMPKRFFSLGTALRLGAQMLTAIQAVHAVGFLHRNLCPANFFMGRASSSTARTVYIQDFALARKYTNQQGEVREPRSEAPFRGTVRYASVRAHNKKVNDGKIERNVNNENFMMFI
jgi:tau tubulin kinase